MNSARHLTPIPTRYGAGLFYVRPVTPAGDTALLYTDTGGGLFIIRSLARQMTAPVRFVGMEQGDSAFATPFPVFRPGTALPSPIGRPDGLIPVSPDSDVASPRWEGAEGTLGQQWFAGRVWVFDYLLGRLSVFDEIPAPHPLDAHTIAIGFKDPPAYSFPRIRVRIDGDSLDLLLDTGARTQLTPDALRAIADAGPAVRATSFMEQRVAARWHTKHPDWRFLAHGEAGTGADMIEVPWMYVAGFVVEHVWFTIRPNANFDTVMSQYTDKPIVGALGGSALRSSRLVLDYPNRRATFGMFQPPPLGPGNDWM